MKRNLRLSICLIVYLLAVQFNLKAQAPAELNYQAVVRNTSGQVVASSAVALRFTIHNDSATGAQVYTETIQTTTNAFGLANVQIGSVANLGIVDWGHGTKFLQVDADINNAGYVTMGTSQLISVPYALFSGNSTPGPVGPTGLSGTAGVTGVQGSAGAIGATGIMGATGAQGLPGVIGVTGATGVDGAQGATGLQGNIGAQGTTGADGVQGATGAIGATGADGAQGVTGVVGPTGNAGAQGVGVASVTDNGNGTATVLLTNGNSSVITLPVEAQGATGLQGNQGQQGPTGTDGGGLPAGAISYFAAATVPTGYLECNGQAVSRTTYSTLFAFIGTIYGVGDGSTTFNLPDLRGEFVRGYDDGRGVDAGRQIGSFQDATGLGNEVHQTVELYYDNNDGALYSPFVVNSSNGFAGTNRTISYFKVRPRNVSLMPCIKY